MKTADAVGGRMKRAQLSEAGPPRIRPLKSMAR